jgi:hypothetical protein
VAAFDEGEGCHPKEPSGDENGVRVDWHGSDCSPAGIRPGLVSDGICLGLIPVS